LVGSSDSDTQEKKPTRQEEEAEEWRRRRPTATAPRDEVEELEEHQVETPKEALEAVNCLKSLRFFSRWLFTQSLYSPKSPADAVIFGCSVSAPLTSCPSPFSGSLFLGCA